MTLCDRIGLKDNGGIFYLFYYLQKMIKKLLILSSCSGSSISLH